MTDIVPIHYNDEGRICPTSGDFGWVEGETCSRGCASSKTHYTNDGHTECEEK